MTQELGLVRWNGPKGTTATCPSCARLVRSLFSRKIASDANQLGLVVLRIVRCPFCVACASNASLGRFRKYQNLVHWGILSFRMVIS